MMLEFLWYVFMGLATGWLVGGAAAYREVGRKALLLMYGSTALGGLAGVAAGLLAARFFNG